MAKQPRDFAEAVREYLPSATDEKVAEIRETVISTFASPAEMLQELDAYMASMGVKKKRGQDG